MNQKNSNYQVKIKKGPITHIHDEQLSKVYVTNNLVEVITVQKRTSNMPFRKITSDTILNTQTGELIKCQHKATNRIENNSNLKRSFNVLRRLINNNFTGNKSEKHVVLTYANMVDYNTANLGFRKFWRKFAFKHTSCDYIRVIEPQQSGNWHIHALVVDHTRKALYINYSELFEMWGLGLTRVNDLPFVENFGAYFSVIFKDDNIYENDDAIHEEGYSRAIIKGERLRYYPPRFKLFTCSKGIRRPIPIDMPYSEVKKLVGKHLPSYAYTNHIIATEDGTEYELNSITYEQYKCKN